VILIKMQKGCIGRTASDLRGFILGWAAAQNQGRATLD
jgi:hypothetical protein